MPPTVPWQPDVSSPSRINLLGRTSQSTRPIWYRHQTALESTAFGDLNRIVSSIHISSSSSRPLNLNVIKTAFRQLRFDHPAIASEHAWCGPPPAPENAVFAYEVPGSEDDVDSWLARVVLDAGPPPPDGDLDAAIAALISELVKPSTAYRPVLLVYHIPAGAPGGEHGVVFDVSHCVFDALGCFQLMDLCLSRIADALLDADAGKRRRDLPWGEETARLPPAFLDAARIPSTADRTAEDEVMLQHVRSVVDSLSTAHTLPSTRAHVQSSPSAPGVFTHIIPTDRLQIIRTSARTHGCTIHSLLMAVLSLACVRIKPPIDRTRVSAPYLLSPVDARPLCCTDPYDRAQWAVRLSMGFNSYLTRGLDRFNVHEEDGSVRVEAQDVWTLAREVREQTEKQRKHVERMAVWSTDVLTTIVTGSQNAKDNGILPRTEWSPILSSFGVLDTYLLHSYPPLTISAPRLRPSYSDHSPAGWLALHCFTWGGRLMMEFSFPEGAMGAAGEQREALKEGREGEAIALRVVDEVISMLEAVACTG